MSRHAAATNAGRSRTAPAVARRVSGPVERNRRDVDGPRGERSTAERDAPAASTRAPAQRARSNAGGRAAAPQRPPRARIDASALAYAGAAIAAPGPLTTRRRPAARTLAPRPRRLAYGGVAIASRVAGVAIDVSASRLMDRLVRGRVWIGVVAFCLIGLVAMQVSLLKLNSGIGRAVQTATTLERSNASLRAEISRLTAGDRIQRLATANGMVMPAPSDVVYLRGHGDAARAAQRMRAPDPNVAPGPAGAATPAAPTVTGPAPTGALGQVSPGTTTSSTGSAPAGTEPAGTAPAQTTPAGTPPTGTAPATTAPAGTAPAATAPAPTAPTTTGAAVLAGAPSGGAAPQATTQTP